MKKPVQKKLVINRARWVNAGSKVDLGDTSLLRNSMGRMCCLGFCAMQLGKAKVRDIISQGSPTMVNTDVKWPAGILSENGDNSVVTTDLIGINDDEGRGLTRREREKAIKERFATIGIKVSFIGAYPKKALDLCAERRRVLIPPGGHSLGG